MEKSSITVKSISYILRMRKSSTTSENNIQFCNFFKLILVWRVNNNLFIILRKYVCIIVNAIRYHSCQVF